MKPKWLRAGVAVSVVVLLCVAVVFVWLWNERSRTTTLAGEAQVLRDRATAIEEKAPAAGASLDDRLAYYDQLVQAKRASEDHRGAIVAFESRRKLSEKNLDYMDYVHIALSYQAVTQKSDALSALAQAEKLLPSDNPAEGFFRAEIVEDITKMRNELQ